MNNINWASAGVTGALTGLVGAGVGLGYSVLTQYTEGGGTKQLQQVLKQLDIETESLQNHPIAFGLIAQLNEFHLPTDKKARVYFVEAVRQVDNLFALEDGLRQIGKPAEQSEISNASYYMTEAQGAFDQWCAAKQLADDTDVQHALKELSELLGNSVTRIREYNGENA